MFKLIFRTITFTMFLVFLTVGLALWKGGEPFRLIGEGTVIIGKSISEFGDFVDDVIKGSNVLQDTYKEIKKKVDEKADQKREG